MKNKNFANILFAVTAVFILYVAADAQQGIIQFNSGITVAIKTETTPPTDSRGAFGNIYSYNETNSGNVIHRVMTDTKNKIYFGYDLEVEPLGEAGKFKISIKPLSKAPGQLIGQNNKSGSGSNRVLVGNMPNYDDFTTQTLPKYPEPVIVGDGDTLTLDLLENPQTKAKISDLIKIIFKSSQWPYYLSEEKQVKDFTIDEVMLKLEKPKISINDKSFQTNSSIAGQINSIYIQGKGRFFFSFSPQPGYDFQKIGTIQNNKISFDLGGDHYEIVSKTPILGAGGNWNLWVLHDPNYQPTDKLSADSPYIFWAADKVEYLFNK